MVEETGAAIDAGAIRRALYVADPMCSWCWGFAPEIAAMAEAFSGRLPIRLVVGGLRAGETRAMAEQSKAYVRTHWEHVAAETGQPFDFSFFDREGFVYDTEPACRAAVVMRSLDPDRALDFFTALQTAFYAEGQDITDAERLADIAAVHGAARDDFAFLFTHPDIVRATRGDILMAQAMGITAFPAVVLQDGQSLQLLTMGYQPFAALKEPLNLWLDRLTDDG